MITEIRVVALDPTSRGYGFVCFEGIGKLVDWGHTQVKSKKHAKTLESIASLLAKYDPQVVVIEDTFSLLSRRSKRVKNLLTEVVDFVLSSNKEIECYSTMEVYRCFTPDGQITKYEIAELIASMYPELAPRLPPKRKIWMSEDERTSIFDAAALALSFYWYLDDANIRASLETLNDPS